MEPNPGGAGVRYDSGNSPSMGLLYNDVSSESAQVERVGPASERSRWSARLHSGKLLFWIGALVATLVSVARIALLNSLTDQSYFSKYTYFASRLLQGDVIRDRLGDLSPLYLWMVTALEGLRATQNEFRGIQVLALGGVALLCAVIAWRFGGVIAAAGAMLLVFTSRAALVNASDVEPETMILLLDTAALTVLLAHSRPVSHLSFRRFAFAGALIALSAAARPTALAFLAVVFCWIAWLRVVERRSEGNEAKLRSLPWGLVAGAAVPLLIVMGIQHAMTGSAMIMDPGTVFYEGMNPLSTGYSGVRPRIIDQLEPTIDEPDTLHVLFRLIPSKASGRLLTREESNRYWIERALAFARAYPARAATLVARKFRLALSSREEWDLIPMMLKDVELREHRQWIPFGVVVALAAAGVVLVRRRRNLSVLLLYLATAAIPLVVFYVTSRQRLSLLPALAILGGIAISSCVELLRIRQFRRVALASFAMALLALVLSLHGHVQREASYLESIQLRLDAVARLRSPEAAASSRPSEARLRLIRELWSVPERPSSPLPLIRAASLREIREGAATPRLFDLARLLQSTGDWQIASQIFARLAEMDYRPVRASQTTSSVAFFRARCALHLGRRAEASRFAAEAMHEAPGDAEVLALFGALDRGSDAARRAERLLGELHDPFTAELARAHAAFDLGESQEALERTNRLLAVFPPWRDATELKARILDSRSAGAKQSPAVD